MILLGTDCNLAMTAEPSKADQAPARPAGNPWGRFDANATPFQSNFPSNGSMNHLARFTSDSSNEPNTSSSSVSSPTTEHAEVEALLNGINHVRTNDLFKTPPRTTSNIIAPATRPQQPHSILGVRSACPVPLGFPGENKAVSVSVPVSTPTASGAVQHPSALADPEADFPALFKVYPCPTAAACYAAGSQAECFYYHSLETDRRRACVTRYRPYMCRFIGEAGGCWKGDRCPFAHNDFERRYHPDRFGKETCRDFLRDDCPRRYCTFRHEVSAAVQAAVTAIDAMQDKELLQLVLRLSDVRGRALSEKLARRFGFGRKHAGWRLDGFGPNPAQVEPGLAAAVDGIRVTLRSKGERKWAAILKTLALRDMISGVRKVTEEIRERLLRRTPELAVDTQRLIRTVFSNANWSCHSHEGDNPFVVTPNNQADAVAALAKLTQKLGTSEDPGACHSPVSTAELARLYEGYTQPVPMPAVPPLYAAHGAGSGRMVRGEAPMAPVGSRGPVGESVWGKN